VGKEKLMRHLGFMTLILMIIGIGCSQIRTSTEEKQLQATRQVQQYPWVYYPIGEESKVALCQALQLPDNDNLCREGIPVMHQDIVEKVKEVFPINETTYDEVEARLGDFPHSLEETRQPSGTLVGLRQVYRLTEYKGACIYFQISLDASKTLERIYASSLGSGPSPTTCGP
jgi:hypothetical protein